jgi:hypothetical protein
MGRPIVVLINESSNQAPAEIAIQLTSETQESTAE